MSLPSDVIRALQGKTLATAESCTGGLIGGALTGVSGSSKVYKGGVISYWSQIKEQLLDVDGDTLANIGPVSAEVAKAMAEGARKLLQADIAVSVTGLAGPDGDEFGNPVGLVFLGYADDKQTVTRKFHFSGDRDTVRKQAVDVALKLILEMQ